MMRRISTSKNRAPMTGIARFAAFVAMIISVFLFFSPGSSVAAVSDWLSAAAKRTANGKISVAERTLWTGEINGKIPVSVWLEQKDGLTTGELLYVNSKTRTPFRLLGTYGTSGESPTVSLQEMLPGGLVTGMISASIKGEVLEGVWMAPEKIKETGTRYTVKDMQQYSLKLTQTGTAPGSFHWEYSPESLTGRYAYTYGPHHNSGTLDITSAPDGGVSVEIHTHTAAPAFNMADVDPTAGERTGNRIVCSVDDSCAFEVLLFSDFAKVSTLKGRECDGWFGRGAYIDGNYIRAVVNAK